MNVFVGYADNLRASGFFPTPWIGDPSVVSETLPQTIDAGAVRIENTSATSITITNFTVTLPFGGQSFSLWSPLTIAPGQNGIFTQTTAYDFDASDFGQFGVLPPASLAPNVPGNNLIGGCSSPTAIVAAAGFTATCAGSAPVITFQENGNPVSLTDSGHILNTGDWDFVTNAAFGEDGNESINWNLVGVEPTRGGGGGGGSVAEPATLSLLACGLLGLFAVRRRTG